MAVAPGTRLGPYEIGAQIGAGGMGEVYRATDTSLGRQVAIKVLPEAVSLDADRIARFEREARALAALNHVNIAAIHGLERSGGVPALVLELVEGPTLADRLVHGAVPVSETIAIAKQIAEALEAAHEQGVIHRDLKPANIKVRDDGTVKVLDFGLAKLAQPDAAGTHASATLSPTITSPALMTGVGVLLGTAAYMSPEQARGREADRRSDIWAFGCVLYEMLSGARAFAGDEVSDTLASVLAREPDWSRLPADVPALVAQFLRRCLHKDRRYRVGDIHDMRLVLEGAFELPIPVAAELAPQTRRVWLQRSLYALAGAGAGAALGIRAWRAFEPAAAAPVVRSRFMLPVGQQFSSNFTRKLVGISSDGTQMAYSANNRLFLRELSELGSRPLQGTESTRLIDPVNSPVFSPDGRFVAYHDATLKKIQTTGGTAVTVWPGEVPWGMSWSGDWIVFGLGPRGIMRVPANGGMAEQLVTVKPGELAAHPHMLPGGRVMLFTLAQASNEDRFDRWDSAQIVAYTLSTSETKSIIAGADATYLASGHLVFARNGSLFAVRFEPGRLAVTDGAVPIVEGVQRTAGIGDGSTHYEVTNTGTLDYAPGSPRDSARRLMRMHRRGGSDPIKLPLAPYRTLRLSPDGQQIAYDIDTIQEGQVWIYRLAGDAPPRQLTLQGRNRLPIWSDDGTRVVFQSDRDGDLGLFWQRADGTGTAERLTTAASGEAHIPESFSPAGGLFSYSVATRTSATLWTYSVRDRKASRFSDVESILPFNSEISRDGRWVAYTLRSNNTANIYVEPLPATGERFPITTANGHHPVWLRDGSGLSYRVGGGEQVVVAVKTRPIFSWGNPESAIATNLPTVELTANRSYDITPDGATFFVVAIDADTQSGAVNSQELHVVVNWHEELKRLAP